MALDVVADVVGRTTAELAHQIEPAFANDRLISPAILELKKLERESNDVRIKRELAHLHALFARNQARIGRDSMEHARIAVDLATESFETSSDDSRAYSSPRLRLQGSWRIRVHSRALVCGSRRSAMNLSCLNWRVSIHCDWLGRKAPIRFTFAIHA